MPKVFIHPQFHSAHNSDSEINLDMKKTAGLRSVLTEACGDDKNMLFRIIDELGELRPNVAVFVGNEHCKYLGGLEANVGLADEVSVYPALSGG